MRDKTFTLMLATVVLLMAGCPSKEARQANRLATQASALMEDENYHQAADKLRQAVELEPKRSEFRMMLGKTLVKAGNPVAARKHYKRGAEILKPRISENPQTIGRYLMFLICLDRESKAREVLEKAQERFKDKRRLRTMQQNFDKFVSRNEAYVVPEEQETEEEGAK